MSKDLQIIISKVYVKRIKKILEKNTRYETIRMWDEPTPYILTNEKDYNKLMKYIEKILKENK